MNRKAGMAPPLRRRLLWGVLTAVMLAIGFTAVMAPRWTRPVVGEPPMSYGRAPDFSLVNRDGRTLSNEDLLGAPWVADFIFTRCAISCPRMTQRMIQLESLWPADLRTARVSFSVDPEFDTPVVLQAYASSWGIEDPRWFFLTGDRDVMQSLVMQGFKLALETDPPPGSVNPDEPILHSTRFVLVDAAGSIRGYYDVVEGGELERLRRDLGALQRETPEGKGR
jgi:protein SCO1/2